MKLLQRLLGRINGLHYSQDYLCVDKSIFEPRIHVYLVAGGIVQHDISETHAFIGYSPLIFATTEPQGNKLFAPTIELLFSHQLYSPNERFSEKDAVAFLKMEKSGESQAGAITIAFYEGRLARHSFISSFQQAILRVNDRLYNRKPGNVYLPGNLLKQVQVAYSYPRTISLITVGRGELFNLFPTDLHGPVASTHYIISLRHQGKACAQVLTAGRLLLSEMNAATYREVYALGRNHMQEPRSKDQLPIFSDPAGKTNLPVPRGATRYRELYLENHFIQGIHRIMIFRTAGFHVTNDPSTLAHIHNVYATWRDNKGMEGNYLLR